MENSKTLHFSISGEYISNLTFELFTREYNLHKAVQILKTITDNYKIIRSILIGCKQFVGVNEFTLEKIDKTLTPEELQEVVQKIYDNYENTKNELYLLKDKIYKHFNNQSVFGVSYRRISNGYCEGLADTKHYLKKQDELRELTKNLKYINILFNDVDANFKNEIPIPPVYENLSSLDHRDWHSFETIIDKYKRYIDGELDVFDSDKNEVYFKRSKEDVEKYIDEQIELDNLKTIEPVKDILKENKDAGWLAPNGDFYGLNGDIANLLHDRISDLLIENGIINPEGYISKDAYLESKGWIRVSKRRVLAGLPQLRKAGLLKEQDKNNHLTKEQQEFLYKYGQINGGFLTFGLDNKIPAVRITAYDIPAFEKLFIL